MAPIADTANSDAKIPSHWKRGVNTNPNRSMTELVERRKLSMKPEAASFDLNEENKDSKIAGMAIRNEDDFQKMKNRYPEHPISRIVPKNRTKEEMM